MIEMIREIKIPPIVLTKEMIDSFRLDSSYKYNGNIYSGYKFYYYKLPTSIEGKHAILFWSGDDHRPYEGFIYNFARLLNKPSWEVKFRGRT